jgi:hypothetical protein
MIIKNGFELEYTDMLVDAKYLTLEQWLTEAGPEIEFEWMDVNKDEIVSWPEFLEAKI